MSESTLLSNDHIVFIFEKFVFDELVGSKVIDHELKKIESIGHKIDNADPIVKSITKMITSGMLDDLKRNLKDFQEGNNDAGKLYVKAKEIVSALELAYYAITGNSKQDVIDGLVKKDNFDAVISHIISNRK